MTNTRLKNLIKISCKNNMKVNYNDIVINNFSKTNRPIYLKH